MSALFEFLAAWKIIVHWQDVALLLAAVGVPASLWALHAAPKVPFRWPLRRLTSLLAMLFWFAFLAVIVCIRQGWLH